MEAIEGEKADLTKFLDRNFREIRSGLVSLADFQEYLHGLGVPKSVREEVKDDLKKHDHVDTGEVQFEDFQTWFNELPDNLLSKLLKRMAHEEHQQIRRESIARPEPDEDAGSRPIIRAMFRISDRDGSGHVTRNELLELMSNFGFSSLEDGDEDWVELEDDEDVSFDEFYEWWTSDGSFKYTGGGIFATVESAWRHFQQSDKDADGVVDKAEFTAYFQSIGASDSMIADASVMFEKADAFDDNPPGKISFETFAGLLQDCPDDVHALLKKTAKHNELRQYKIAEEMTALAMFKKFDTANKGAVPSSVLDALLTEYGIGKVDMSDEDIAGDVEFDGIYAWWSMEGRYKDEEPTPGVVGLRGLLYAYKHFVEPHALSVDDTDVVELKEFYSWLLHSNITEWHLQASVDALEIGSDSDASAAVPVSYREFVARIGGAPASVHDLLRKAARQTLPVAVPDPEPEEEEFDREPVDTAMAGMSTTGQPESEEPAKEATPPAREAAPADVKVEMPRAIEEAPKPRLTVQHTGQEHLVPEDPLLGATNWEKVKYYCKHTSKTGEVLYCGNTSGNWGKIWLALCIIWSLLGLLMMGLMAAEIRYGLTALYVYLVSFLIAVIVVAGSIVVGAVEASKEEKVVFKK